MEQLRIILEPTKTTRLKGDYRTGKRINMRRVIPYIASNFRKDKIWLRRTKPSKRECEIVLALDDSSSMADSNVQRLSFQALATLWQALSVLESGKLGVIRFGQSAQAVHPLSQTFSFSDGANVVGSFAFDQPVTNVLHMLQLAQKMLGSSVGSSSASELKKILFVLSDGKGIFSEGKQNVQAAVRQLRLQNVFLVYVILETHQGGSSDSVLDIRMPIFDPKGNLQGIETYMEHFPFPYYIILRDISYLPRVLGDALRQWLELIAA
jgi:midasin